MRERAGMPERGHRHGVCQWPFCFQGNCQGAAPAVVVMKAGADDDAVLVDFDKTRFAFQRIGAIWRLDRLVDGAGADEGDAVFFRDLRRRGDGEMGVAGEPDDLRMFFGDREQLLGLNGGNAGVAFADGAVERLVQEDEGGSCGCAQRFFKPLDLLLGQPGCFADLLLFWHVLFGRKVDEVRPFFEVVIVDFVQAEDVSELGFCFVVTPAFVLPLVVIFMVAHARVHRVVGVGFQDLVDELQILFASVAEVAVDDEKIRLERPNVAQGVRELVRAFVVIHAPRIHHVNVREHGKL
jgi:hypothetical protein